MTTIKYSVPNISCGHCVHTIQMEVADLAWRAIRECRPGIPGSGNHLWRPGHGRKHQRLLWLRSIIRLPGWRFRFVIRLRRFSCLPVRARGIIFLRSIHFN